MIIDSSELEIYATMIPEKHSKEELKVQFSSNKDNISVDDAIISWCEHDAIHYLTSNWYDIQSEIKVAKIERHFNCGWYKHGLKYNKFAEFHLNREFSIPNFLNINLIKKVSNQLKDLLYQTHDA